MSVYNKHLLYKNQFDKSKFVASGDVVTLSVRQVVLIAAESQRIIR
jgi:hypothetical protein